MTKSAAKNKRTRKKRQDGQHLTNITENETDPTATGTTASGSTTHVTACAVTTNEPREPSPYHQLASRSDGEHSCVQTYSCVAGVPFQDGDETRADTAPGVSGEAEINLQSTSSRKLGLRSTSKRLPLGIENGADKNEGGNRNYDTMTKSGKTTAADARDTIPATRLRASAGPTSSKAKLKVSDKELKGSSAMGVDHVDKGNRKSTDIKSAVIECILGFRHTISTYLHLVQSKEHNKIAHSLKLRTPNAAKVKAGAHDKVSEPLLCSYDCTSRFQGWDSQMQGKKSTNVYWWTVLFALGAWSFGSHLYKIEQPAHVCWDETHFGKMGGWYIKREFFFDVHPPLGKMLIGLAGHLEGYNGSFSFDKPGLEYNDTKYVGMRVFCGMLGSTLPLLGYGSVWEMTHSLPAATTTGLLFALDIGLLTLTRYILLDAPLLFFILGAIFCMLKFLACQHRPYSVAWWGWLAATGFFLAGSIGVKFVGLFVVLYVGYTTALDLWRMLGNLDMSLMEICKHVVARAACLIVLPIALYVVFYMIHFAVLSKSGPGDGHFSSVFQASLEGNPLNNASLPMHVAYGSKISIKNYRTGGAYLHSHWHLYPEEVGAHQQQVTTYSHKDYNNHWVVKRPQGQPNQTERPELLKNGDVIRLEHWPTKRNLHSHRLPAPVTKNHFQVTAYGDNGEGDSNDLFRIEVAGLAIGKPVETMRSTFHLVHESLGCLLHSHKKQLPKWAYEQLEVTCNPQVKIKSDDNLWHVEMVMDARLPNASFSVYAPSFLQRFYESHVIQMQGNSGLKPKEGEDTSQPWEWPINYRVTTRFTSQALRLIGIVLG